MNSIKRLKVMIMSCFVVFFLFSTTIFAVEKYQNKDIAIFNMFVGTHTVPDSFINTIQQSIYATFNDLGRFNLINYDNYSMDVMYINDFIAYIKSQRAESLPQNKDSKFGNLVIDSQTFAALANSFFVVIPNITRYAQAIEERTENKQKVYYYRTQAIIIIKIIDVQKEKLLSTLTFNYDESSKLSSIDSEHSIFTKFPFDLNYKIRNIEEFTLKAGVIKVEGSTIYLNLGQDSGVKVGMEFFVMSKEQVGNEFIERKVGLIRIKEVSNTVAIGEILIEDVKFTEGDQLKEFARLGANVYLALFYSKVDLKSNPLSLLTNEEQSSTIGLEFMLSTFISYNIFVKIGGTAYFTNPLALIGQAGIGYELFMGRLSLGLSVSFNYGVAGINIFSENTYGAYIFGGTGEVFLSFLTSYESKIQVTAFYRFLSPVTTFYFDIDQNSTLFFPINKLDYSGYGIRIEYIIRM